MKFKINVAGGTVEVEGRKFSHYINNVRFWFAVQDRTLTITHLARGLKACTIPSYRLAAHQGDAKSAARATLDELVKQKGAERVYQALRDAEKSLNQRDPS